MLRDTAPRSCRAVHWILCCVMGRISVLKGNLLCWLGVRVGSSGSGRPARMLLMWWSLVVDSSSVDSQIRSHTCAMTSHLGKVYKRISVIESF